MPEDAVGVARFVAPPAQHVSPPVGVDGAAAVGGARNVLPAARSSQVDRPAPAPRQVTSHRPVYAALLDDEQLELLLAPPRTDAPEPWAVSDEGRRWVLKRIDSPRATAAAPAAYPALVCLGRDEQGRDVLVDLEASGGPVQITGDAVVASRVAAALAIRWPPCPGRTRFGSAHSACRQKSQPWLVPGSTPSPTLDP